MMRAGPNRAYYLKKRAGGHTHAQAVITLARRRIDVLWALLRDDRTFSIDPPTSSPRLDNIIDASGDRSYLVLAKPNVIMNDIRLRGLGVAGSHAAGRKAPHNHAQAVRNLRRTLRNAAGGARLIQVDGLDKKSAAELAAGLADTFQSFTGLSAVSIASIVTRTIGQAFRLPVLTPRRLKRDQLGSHCLRPICLIEHD